MFAKSLAVIATLILGVAAQAHQVQALRALQSPALQSVYSLAQNLEKQNTSIVTKAYQVQVVTPVNDSETQEETVARILKSVLHHDYPITGDDGGYSLVAADQSSLEAQSTSIAQRELAQGNPLLLAGLRQAVQQGALLIYGGGSGNNTSADIAALFDPSTQELVYIMSSNFGSDD